MTLLFERAGMLGVVVALLAGGSLAGCGGISGGNQSAAPDARAAYGADDRLLITGGRDVLGLAATRRYLFLLTDRSLATLDRQFARWLPALALEPAPGGSAGFVREARVIAADPSDDVVWIGGYGEVLVVRPALGDVQRTIVPGRVESIVFDRRDPGNGAFVRAGGSWLRANTLGGWRPATPAEVPAPADRITQLSVAELYRAYPALASFERLLTRDGSMRSHRVVAAARAPESGSDVWLGTLGGGAFAVDANFARGTPLPYGLAAPSASALARAADGVWVAGGGTGGGGRESLGVSFVSGELSEFRWLEPGAGRWNLRARARDMDTRDGTLWLATDLGLVRGVMREADRSAAWALVRDLPGDDALCVLAFPGGAWVGTRGGLVAVHDTAPGSRPPVTGRTLTPAVPVRALAAAGDTLWIGSDAGLLRLTPGDSAPVRAALRGAPTGVPTMVRALAAHDSVIAIATTDALVIVERGSLRPVGERLSPPEGVWRDLRAVALDGTEIVLVTAHAVHVVDRRSGARRTLGAVGQPGAELLDALLTPQYLWVGTSAGLVRLRRDASWGGRVR